jgi:hypothetical protein
MPLVQIRANPNKRIISETRDRPPEKALPVPAVLCYPAHMSNLAEIEAAVDALPAEQKQELMVFLAARLRAQPGQLPEPRKFSREQVASWIAEDEADMQRFHKGK